MSPTQNFLSVIYSYDLVKGHAAAWMAMILPWVEFVLGAFLVVGLWTRLSLAAAWICNVTFIFALASTFIRKIELDGCGCFGGAHLSPAQTLILDNILFFLIGCCFIFINQTKNLSLDNRFHSK